MTEPSQPVGADPTRDIRLPPLADRPLPPLRPESEPAAPEPAAAALQVDQPTDEVGAPPTGVRDRTLTFDGTSAERWAAGLAASPDPAWAPLPPRSGPVVGARPRPPREGGRRWPWVVLSLIPVLIIVGAGLWLLLLLRAA
jgi:hypothetical protein